MKIIEYKTAHGSSVVDLDRNINKLLSEGFQPFESAYLSDQDVEGKVDTFAVWQPMVRYDD